MPSNDPFVAIVDDPDYLKGRGGRGRPPALGDPPGVSDVTSGSSGALNFLPAYEGFGGAARRRRRLLTAYGPELGRSAPQLSGDPTMETIPQAPGSMADPSLGLGTEGWSDSHFGAGPTIPGPGATSPGGEFDTLGVQTGDLYDPSGAFSLPQTLANIFIHGVQQGFLDPRGSPFIDQLIMQSLLESSGAARQRADLAGQLAGDDPFLRRATQVGLDTGAADTLSNNLIQGRLQSSFMNQDFIRQLMALLAGAGTRRDPREQGGGLGVSFPGGFGINASG